MCQKQGFTLIELLVVVLIIGILSAVALPRYEKAVNKTKFVSMLPLLADIKQMQELYYLENGAYAKTWEELGFELPQGFNKTVGGTQLYNTTKGQRLILYSENGRGTSVGGGLSSPDTLYVWAYDYSGMATAGLLQCYGYDTRALEICRSVSGGQRHPVTNAYWVK